MQKFWYCTSFKQNIIYRLKYQTYSTSCSACSPFWPVRKKAVNVTWYLTWHNHGLCDWSKELKKIRSFMTGGDSDDCLPFGCCQKATGLICFRLLPLISLKTKYLHCTLIRQSECSFSTLLLFVFNTSIQKLVKHFEIWLTSNLANHANPWNSYHKIPLPYFFLAADISNEMWL